MSREDDLALARRARHDRTAFDTLFDRYVDRIHRLARRRAATARDAEELTARMLERVFGQLDYGGATSLDAWVLSRCKSVLAQRDPVQTGPARAATPHGV